MVSAVEFQNYLTRWAAEKLPAAAKALQVETATRLGRGVVKRTPVRTGLARGNWRLVIGNSLQGRATTRKDTDGGATIAAIVEQASRLAAYSSFTLYNNVPYVPRLEEGWSQQAPLGMIRITVQEVRAQRREIAKAAGLKVGGRLSVR